MKLLIVESPGKIKKLSSFLGPDFRVMASVGHVLDLPKKSLGIDLGQSKIKVYFELNTSKLEIIDQLKAISLKAEEIFLATDPDREGEAIAYHVARLLPKESWNKIKRISFNQITSSAVKAALSEPRKIDTDLVFAQQARRVVDRLVGYQVSPLLWKQPGLGNSAGRVQSVAVKMVANRETEISNFISKPYFNLEAEFLTNKDKQAFKSKLIKFDNKKIVNTPDKFKPATEMVINTSDEAQSIIDHLRGGVFSVKEKKIKEELKQPFPPFVTSSLQQVAHRLKKWSSVKTLQIAQKLYELGLITYMRTDSPSFSKEAVTSIRAIIEKTYGKAYLPKSLPLFKAKDKRSLEAHECIRPVDQAVISTNLKNCTSELVWLYNLIWDRAIASQMSASSYEVGEVRIVCNLAEFETKGRRLLFDGWQIIYRNLNPKNSNQEPLEPILPPVSEGDKLVCNNILALKDSTKPPTRYSEGSLIKALEKQSIGRPSTYATILANIKQRGYISDEEHFFHATATGSALVKFLDQHFNDGFMNFAFTAKMEESLDEVAKGKQNWENVVQEFYKQLRAQLYKI